METTEISAQDIQKQKKGNLIWLVVLVALIIGIMFSSQTLFNNYWDPKASEETWSH